MAKRNSTSIKRKDTFFVDFDNTQWLKQFDKKVEDFNGKGGAFERAVKRVIPLVEKDFRSFMAQHHLTGSTIESLMTNPNLYWGDTTYYKTVGTVTKGKKGFTGHNVKVDKTKNILFVEYGFQIDKGGLPALFLDIGTHKQAGSFFVYYAVENNMREFQKIFKEEVTKELKAKGLL